MSKRIYVQAQADHIASLFRGSPLAAVEELVWNALDADAREVKVDVLTNPLGGVEAVRVSDDGTGIDVLKADSTFGSLGGSWKRENAISASHRRLHGRHGRGRFKAFALGGHVEWRTTVREGGELLSYRLWADADHPGVFELEDAPRGPGSGTEVLVTNVRATCDSLLQAGETVQNLAARFALYLKSYPDVRIYFNGLPVTPVIVQKRTTDYKLTLSNGRTAKLEVIEWKRKFVGAGRLVFAGPDGFQLHEQSAGVRSGGASFTAYLVSERFPALHAENALLMDELDPEVRLYLEETRKVLKAHFAAYAQEQQDELVREWEERFGALKKKDMGIVYAALGKMLLGCFLILMPLLSQASWYWPFKSSETNDLPRLSELMKPATTNIDAAADFAAEGKTKEAQDCYRAAIAALEKIERENPERAATPEFATVRNKRAYINAALDAMLLDEARQNAKAVAVTDTSELEVRLLKKPWNEFRASYTTLTNADDILMRRVARLDAAERAQVAAQVEDCAAARERVRSAEREAALAIARAERFSETASRAEGARVFDVCKKDARAAVRNADEAWPVFGEKLAALAQALGEETELPEKADDKGLVKEESDTRPKVESQLESYVEKERKRGKQVKVKAEKVKAEKAVQAKIRALLEDDPDSRKAQMLQAGEELRSGDLTEAKAVVKKLLDEKPNDSAALNMRAAIEAAEGDLKAAEKTLDLAIRTAPRDYHAYYNMANVYLEKDNVDGARRYYETGRSFSGPRDEDLEKAVMGK